MAKVHITLVGGQPAPVYNGIAYANPDKVVFVYSEQTIENVKKIAESIQIPFEKRKFDPVDFNQIEKKMSELVEKHKNDEVSINISSGTKNWAYYFGRFPNATVFFVDQNNTVWDFTHKLSSTIEFASEMQFKLYGTVPSGYTKLSEYSDEDKKVLSEIVELQRFDDVTFVRLVNMMKEHLNETYHSIEKGASKGSFILWNTKEKCMCMSITNRKGALNKKLKSPHVRNFILNAGWFEYKVADILSRWKHSQEIWLNPKFKDENGKAKNEIDIIVNTGVKFLFVEVKTQISNITDIDKFSRAVENFSGSGSKKLFVTQSVMRGDAVEKCRDNGVISFSLEAGHLGMDMESALFLLLDNALFTMEA